VYAVIGRESARDVSNEDDQNRNGTGRYRAREASAQRTGSGTQERTTSSRSVRTFRPAHLGRDDELLLRQRAGARAGTARGGLDRWRGQSATSRRRARALVAPKLKTAWLPARERWRRVWGETPEHTHCALSFAGKKIRAAQKRKNRGRESEEFAFCYSFFSVYIVKL
jgi:hypothetical protein